MLVLVLLPESGWGGGVGVLKGGRLEDFKVSGDGESGLDQTQSN